MKQTVEEAAREYCNNNFPYSEYLDLTVETAFEAGADWQAKQSSWISVEERLPEELTSVLVRSEYEGKSLYEVAFVINGKWKCHNGKPTHWMPIPSFYEILEANKDVLQRLK